MPTLFVRCLESFKHCAVLELGDGDMFAQRRTGTPRGSVCRLANSFQRSSGVISGGRERILDATTVSICAMTESRLAGSSMVSTDLQSMVILE